MCANEKLGNKLLMKTIVCNYGIHLRAFLDGLRAFLDGLRGFLDGLRDFRDGFRDDPQVTLNHRSTWGLPLERVSYSKPSLPLRRMPRGHLLAGYGGPGLDVYFLVLWRSHMD
jgi:hypothetical protein